MNVFSNSTSKSVKVKPDDLRKLDSLMAIHYFFFFFSMGKCYKYGFLTTDPMFSLYALTSEFLQDSGLPFL